LKLCEEHAARQAELFGRWRNGLPIGVPFKSRATTATADQAKPKRPMLGHTIDYRSQHWKAAVHEAGHVAAAKGDPRGATVRSAQIYPNGAGLVNFDHISPDSNVNITVSLGGLAAQELFGFVSQDCGSQDLSDAGVDLRTDHGQYLLRCVRDNLADRKRFIEALAERIYFACPAAIFWDEINELWNSYR